MDFCWSKIEAVFSKDFDIGLRDGQVSQIGAVKTQERAPECIPKVLATISRGEEWSVANRRGLRVERQSGEEVFDGLSVAVDIHAGHAEVVDGPGEGGAEFECLLICPNSLLGLAPVGQGSPKSVP